MSVYEQVQGPILRLFQVQAKPGCAGDLLEKFRITSAAVVDGHPGNQGYFFGRGLGADDNMVIFVSVWADIDAVKKRFGEQWQNSYLPEGYEDLIASCSLHHINASEGWYANNGTRNTETAT